MSWLQTFLTEESAGVVESVRLLFEEQRGGAATIAALGALWSASRGIDGMLRALLVVHGGEERRSWVRRRLLSLAIVLGTVVALAMVLGAFVVGPLFGRGHRLAELLGFGDFFVLVWTWVRFPVVAVVLVLWASIVLHVGRASQCSWRDDVPGAVVAAAGWLGLSFAFRVYLSSALSANQVLGALGGGLILLLWLFLLAASLLMGAEVNEVFAHGRRSTPPTSRPEDDNRASNPPLPRVPMTPRGKTHHDDTAGRTTTTSSSTTTTSSGADEDV